MSNKIAINQFKDHCLEIIDKLQANQQSIIITKGDKPIAKIVPLDIVNSGEFGARNDGATPICNRRATSNDVPNFSSIDYKTKLSLLGILKGKAEIKGDILNPIDERWDANHVREEWRQVLTTKLPIRLGYARGLITKYILKSISKKLTDLI